MLFIKLLMVEFELVSSGVGSDHSVHCATTSDLDISSIFKLHNKQVLTEAFSSVPNIHEQLSVSKITFSHEANI